VKNKYFVFTGLLGLIVVYVFQRQLFFDPFQDFIYNPQEPRYPEFNAVPYIITKVIRYILNDGFALLIIWGLFKNKNYMRFAMIIFSIGLFILLPIYIYLVLNHFHSTYTFLNHLHRIVLNPVLMMLLIPAFYYQQSLKTDRKQ
jgi:exosortase F-associated protein